MSNAPNDIILDAALAIAAEASGQSQPVSAYASIGKVAVQYGISRHEAETMALAALDDEYAPRY